MTNDFIDTEALWDLLPIVDHLDWKVNKYGWVRDQFDRCPLVALADEIGGERSGGTLYPSVAFGKFELGEPLGGQIMGASDEKKNEHRPLLMEILKVKPIPPYVAPPSFWSRFTTRILSIFHNGIR